MFFRKSLRNVFVAFLTVTTSLSQASTVTIPNTFTANTPAVAAQVNANFNVVKTAVDDNDSNISGNNSNISSLLTVVTQLQTDLAIANGNIATLTTALATANSTIATHNTRITAIESNSVLELDSYLMLSTINGYDTAEFTAINIQVNDGSGDTAGVVNGLGNLTIGYNEVDDSASEFCSSPIIVSDSASCLLIGGLWDSNVRRGSHNLILGSVNSYDDFGGIIAGRGNIINGDFASVLGGESNKVNGLISTISGGLGNRANSEASSVSGGIGNHARGDFSSISGGMLGLATGYASSISGGGYFDFSGSGAFTFNIASGDFSSVSGGTDNEASGVSSTIGGGKSRSATGDDDWIAGNLFEDN